MRNLGIGKKKDNQSAERKQQADTFVRSLRAKGEASAWLQRYEQVVRANNPSGVLRQSPAASKKALQTLAKEHGIKYDVAAEVHKVLEADRRREISLAFGQQENQAPNPINTEALNDNNGTAHMYTDANGLSFVTHQRPLSDRNGGVPSSQGQDPQDTPAPIDIAVLKDIYDAGVRQFGNNADAIGWTISQYEMLFANADMLALKNELAEIAYGTVQPPVNHVPLQQTPASIDLARLQDIYSTVRMEIGNDADALVAAIIVYQNGFPQADERQIRHELEKIARETTQPVPAPLDTGTVIDIYMALLVEAKNDTDAAYYMATLALKEIFDADEAQIERALKSIGAQPVPPSQNLTPPSQNQTPPIQSQTPPVTTTSVQFTGEMAVLQEMYEQQFEQHGHDRHMAAAEARKMFIEKYPDIDQRVVDTTLGELIAMHEESGDGDWTVMNTDIEQKPSRGGNVPLSMENITELQSIYRGKLAEYKNHISAKLHTRDAFFEKHPQAQLKQVEAELRKLKEQQELEPVSTSSLTPPVRKRVPKQGDAVTLDSNKVYCGIASPEPVAPGEFFYRERQKNVSDNGARESLNALVGWNCFNDGYVEQVKRDMAAVLGSGTTTDADHLHPEVMAECLRRKARDKEIDAKWANAKAQTLRVNDELWAHLDRLGQKPAIIGRPTFGDFVTHRVDTEGQSRILVSYMVDETQQTVRQYLEWDMNNNPFRYAGQPQVHLITY